MINVFKEIWCFSVKEKNNLQKSMVIGFINAIFNALLITAIYFVLSDIISNTVSNYTALLAFIIMLVSVLGKIVTQYYSQLQRTHAGYFMVSDKRVDIGKKIKSVPMGYFNNNSLGQITAIETTILNDVEVTVPMILVTILGGFLNTLVFVIFILFLDWRIGTIALVGIVIFLYVTSLMEKKSRESAPERQDAQSTLVEAILETIQGMSVVKAFDLDKNLDKKVNRAIDESCQKNKKVERAMIPYVALQQFILYGCSVAMLFCSIIFFINDSMLLANSLIMIICSFFVYEQLRTAGSCIALLRIAEHSIDKANKIDEVPIMDEGGKDITLETTEIKFQNVSFAYREKKVLNNINVTIPANKMTAIVGPSGSGKTTLCNMIARFWDVDEGKVLIGGVDIKDYTLNSLMKNISMVFQNVYLFADTIENNIKFGKPEASHLEVEEAAKKACCHDFIMSLPNGYDTLIGEGGSTLSGGEKQRVSIARALIKDAGIIIFDEATANVDPENEDRLQKAIEELIKNKTVIMIAHRLKTVANADKILVMDEGKIVQEGKHKELVLKPGIYANFVNERKRAIGWKLGK